MIHLEQVIGRPGQAVQVGDHRTIGVAVQLAVAGFVAGVFDLTEEVERGSHQAAREPRFLRETGVLPCFSLIPQERVHQVADLDPRGLAFSTHHQVNRRLAQRLEVQVFSHHAGVRPAQDNGDVHLLFDGLGRAPRLLHLGRVGGDAHQVRPKFPHEFGQGLFLDIGIVHAHLVSAALGDCAQVGQSQVR